MASSATASHTTKAAAAVVSTSKESKGASTPRPWFYVTMVAQPDYKVPSVAFNTGVATSEHEARAAVVQEFVGHFGDLMENMDGPVGYDAIAERVFGDYYMDNPAFEYRVATGSSWQTPWDMEDICADAWKQFLASDESD